ncbi:sensor domain-containing diguanylate cyclase [Pseudomonas citronellolis]|uniref:sensor domain-containing diguanylate cyclase n=1 Tax=Pseudomonas citronellolis TaxID=53408 RepID=UPI0023E3870F|nr:sensor domain-containing diguanylate cyclase [Pseudomonas citronellolis]MDF3936712.1 diguanylate cyclase [Pseudomonas citronellolis]
MQLFKPSRVFVVMMLLAIGLSLIAGWQMLTMRRDALAFADASGSNTLRLVERDLRRDLDMHAQSLLTISNMIRETGLDDLDSAALRVLVEGHEASSEDMGTIIVTDRYGQLVEDLNHGGESQHDLSMREYFRVHAQGDRELQLSHPFVPSYRKPSLTIALSRSLIDRDGSFMGVVAALKDLRQFDRYIQDLNLADGDIVTLRLLDGTTLAQWPVDRRKRSDSEREAFKAFVASGERERVHDSSDPQHPYWQGLRRVGDYPLVVNVERAHKNLFQGWFGRTLVTSGLLIAFNLATVGLAFGLTRHLHRRDQAENRLRDEASTDALTGLQNRRWFDQAARREWHRHLRGGGQLAVLMLDIDQFKLYNDHYGHPTGDTALAAVAEQVRLGCRRDEDGAARYGGEEFVVILPNCDLTGALTVAENIRAGIENAALPHAMGKFGVVTVSIGAASTSSGPVESVEALVAQADASLYKAKENGRNRVESGAAPTR